MEISGREWHSVCRAGQFTVMENQVFPSLQDQGRRGNNLDPGKCGEGLGTPSLSRGVRRLTPCWCLNPARVRQAACSQAKGQTVLAKA